MKSSQLENYATNATSNVVVVGSEINNSVNNTTAHRTAWALFVSGQAALMSSSIMASTGLEFQNAMASLQGPSITFRESRKIFRLEDLCGDVLRDAARKSGIEDLDQLLNDAMNGLSHHISNQKTSGLVDSGTLQPWTQRLSDNDIERWLNEDEQLIDEDYKLS